jgi:glutamyl-tRNA reductase
VERLMRARRNRPLFLIDIAVPRDIEPAVQQLDSVYLYNIDDLQAIVRQNVGLREQDLATAQAIIAQRAAALLTKLGLAGARARPVPAAAESEWLAPGLPSYAMRNFGISAGSLSPR